jgi:hypothetical protein
MPSILAAQANQVASIFTKLYTKKGPDGRAAMIALGDFCNDSQNQFVARNTFPDFMIMFVRILGQIACVDEEHGALEPGRIVRNEQHVIDLLPVPYHQRREYEYRDRLSGTDHRIGEALSFYQYVTEKIGSVDWAFYITDMDAHERIRYHVAFSLKCLHSAHGADLVQLEMEMDLLAWRILTFDNVFIKSVRWEIAGNQTSVARVYGHVIFTTAE